jgi:hypothetical protein
MGAAGGEMGHKIDPGDRHVYLLLNFGQSYAKR